MSRRNSEKESLLDALVPPPTHPRAGKRILAVSVVAIFILISTMLGVSDTGKAAAGLDRLQGRVQGWVYGTDTSDIQGGRGSGSSSSLQSPLDGAASVDAKEEDAEEESEGAGSDSESGETLDTAHTQSDFAKYLWHRDLEFDIEGNGRLIIVGDVHGMIDELKRFLKELEYSPEVTTTHNDTLVFVGDLVAKHPDIRKSLETVAYIRSLPNAWAVRGNHDQDVINWRNWMTMSESYAALGADDSAPPDDTPEALKHKWRDEHYRIAKALPQASADWMAERSLTLHIRSLHTYVVHAGLLPWTIPKGKGKHGKGGYKTWGNEQGDETRKSTATDGEEDTKKQRKRQEEARRQLDEEDEDILASMDFTNSLNLTDEAVAPSSITLLESSTPDSFTPMPDATSADPSATGGKGRHDKLDPELAILAVPLNRKPYTLLEMRGLLRSGKVTKSNSKGQPWAPIWNRVMQSCKASLAGETPDAESAEAAEEATEEEQVNDDERKHRKARRRKEEKRAAIAAAAATEEQASPARKQPARQCRPLSVVYGHAAARGLDIRPYSFGLDSAAVYGRSFSALVVEGAHHAHAEGRKASHKLQSLDVVIGDRPAKVYSMKTFKPKEKKH